MPYSFFVLIGNGLDERMIDTAYFETELQVRFPEKHLFIRNMCRAGDTASFRPHPSRNSQWAFPGADKFRPEYKIHAGNGHHPTPDQWLTTLHADTILAFFGYNESFDGEKDLAAFEGEIDAFITHTLAQKYNGKTAPHPILTVASVWKRSWPPLGWMRPTEKKWSPSLKNYPWTSG